MDTVYVEMVYTNMHFTDIGKCYRKKEDAIKRLRQLKQEHEATTNHYSEEYLFICYLEGTNRIEVDFETKALR